MSGILATSQVSTPLLPNFAALPLPNGGEVPYRSSRSPFLPEMRHRHQRRRQKRTSMMCRSSMLNCASGSGRTSRSLPGIGNQETTLWYGAEPTSQLGLGLTETANKDGTWLREMSSCCCLTTAGKTRQLLLNTIYIPFLPSLYNTLQH